MFLDTANPTPEPAPAARDRVASQTTGRDKPVDTDKRDTETKPSNESVAKNDDTPLPAEGKKAEAGKAPKDCGSDKPAADVVKDVSDIAALTAALDAVADAAPEVADVAQPATPPAVAVEPPAQTAAQVEATPDLGLVANPELAAKAPASDKVQDDAKPSAEADGADVATPVELTPAASKPTPIKAPGALPQDAKPTEKLAAGTSNAPLPEADAPAIPAVHTAPPMAKGHAPATAEPHIAQAAADPAAPVADAPAKPNLATIQSLDFSLPAGHTAAATSAVKSTSAPAPTADAAVPLAGVAVAIAHQAQAGKNRFEIRLDPPELGRIDVRLDVDRDGNVSSRLVIERQETLDLLRRDASQLERALQQAGLKTADNALEFSLRGQAFGRDPETPHHAAHLTIPEDDAAPLEALRQGYGRLFGLGGGIDIRV